MKKLKVLTVTVLSAALLLCACGGNQTAETTQAATETETTTAAAQEAAGEENEAPTQAEVSGGGDYYMLQGVIKTVSDDGDSFSLLCDDGKTYEISVYDIGDIEVDIEEEAQIAIACVGSITDDLSGVTLVVALPEQEEWIIQTKTGVTTNNAMSAFGIDTDDGENIQFLKDNCPIEDDALSHDDGDHITVIYVISAEGNFPIEIKAAE